MNTRKVFTAIITFAAVINLTACQSKEEQYRIQTKNSAYYDMGYNVYENGLLYTVSNASGKQACFLDYETMHGVPLCSKPNCTHTDSSCVSNLCAGKFNIPIIYHDYVYWFISDYKIVDSDDGKSQKADVLTKCMHASLSSESVEEFAKIETVFMENQIDLAIINDTMYIIGSQEVYQNENDGTWGSFSRSGEQYLYTVNLESADVKNISLINDSPYAKNSWDHNYSMFSEVDIDDIYNGKLYMHYQHVKDSKYITDILNSNITDTFQKLPWCYVNKCLDLETSEITVSDLPYAWWIGENSYIYEENGTFFILNGNGEKRTAENMYENDIRDFTFINGKLWKGSINQVFDVKTGKEFSLSDKYADKNAMVMDFVNGQYVVQYIENNEIKFDWVSEDDLIGG